MSKIPLAIELDDDVFDESFLKELDQLEEFATASTQRPRTNHHQPQPPLPPPFKPYATSFNTQQPRQQPAPHYFPSTTAAAVINTVDNISYSPPRQLSQRFANDVNNENTGSVVTRTSRSTATLPNPEIDFLKSELSRASKQLSDLKEDCSLLRKERDRNEQLKLLQSHAKTASYFVETKGDVEASFANPRIGISPRCKNLDAIGEGDPFQAKTEQKSIGIQTDRGESACPSISGSAAATSSFSVLPKLSKIWASRSSRSLQRDLVSKLLESCATDFSALFGFLGLNIPPKTVKECLTRTPLPANVEDSESVEDMHSIIVMRVSQLYSVLNKLSSDLAPINAFVDVLLNLCKLESAVAVHRSLRILHVAVGYLSSFGRVYSRRDNVRVERPHSGSNAGFVHDTDSSEDEASTSCFESPYKSKSIAEHETAPHIDWLLIFTSMCQTAIRMTEEHVKVEAVSIMTTILCGMNPYSEREQFGEICVYEAVADLLKRDAGFFCQKETVHLVYLLLNCPNIMTAFCSSVKDTEGRQKSASDGVGNFPPQASCAILNGFADCILCPGHSLKELSLCRNAIIVLGFLASSGKDGLDIFLYHSLPKRGNFLLLILQVLVLEIDAEALESNPTPEISKERTLLILEALILLKRLVSHPLYATSVLQVLTSCREIVSLAIDCATRLSRRSKTPQNSDFITKQMRETEVVELASFFRKRLFTFVSQLQTNCSDGTSHPTLGRITG